MRDNDDDRVIGRRTVLTTGAVALGAGLAGCTGDSGTGSETETTDQTEATRTETATDSATTTDPVALDEPVEPTDSDQCAVCEMTVANFPEWNAQLTLDADGGRRAFTCSPGCLVTLAAKPGQFVDGATDADVANSWARDRKTMDLVDATTASWVLDPDDERAGGPMSGNPLPFAEAADAESYVAEYDDLTEHAIVGFDAFDAALAATYRGRFLPDVTDSSVLDAVSVSEDATCPVCGMQSAKFPDANAQVAFEDGGREFPCSPGCLGAFYADTATFADEREQDDIVSAWVHDYGTDELTDALDAWFVLETKGERVSDLPMMTNPVPYAERADAESYVAEYDDLTTDDVVRLTEFTTELGKQYRAKQY